MGSSAEILVSLHGSAAHIGQQEAWQADLKFFERLQADDEEELRRVRWESYQVAAWYVMFQGVIFTAISQPHLLTCALWWSPVSLSLAVSLATILAIRDKLYSMGELQEDINESERIISVLMERLDAIENQGSGFDLESGQPSQEIPRSELAGVRLMLGSRDSVLALLFLVGFSSLIAIFSFKALCREKPR